jgi:hypothetical protein
LPPAASRCIELPIDKALGNPSLSVFTHLDNSPHAEVNVAIACTYGAQNTRISWVVEWIFYFFAEDFFEVVEAELFEDEDFARPAVEVAGAFLLVLLFDAEDLVRLALEERRVVAVRCTTGSATLRRRPGSTRMPDAMLFQRRN